MEPAAMPDRLVLAPKERLEQAAALLARGVARYLRSLRTDAAHLSDLQRGAAHQAAALGPEKPPEFSPQGLELSENLRLTVS
jgi:hypothetical protein